MTAPPEEVVKDEVPCYVVRDDRLPVLRHTDHSDDEVGIDPTHFECFWIQTSGMCFSSPADLHFCDRTGPSSR